MAPVNLEDKEKKIFMTINGNNSTQNNFFIQSWTKIKQTYIINTQH